MLRFAALLFVALISGCAASGASRDGLEARVLATFPGPSADVVWVPSENVFADAGRISRLSIDSTAASNSLVQTLRQAKREPVRVLIAGANSSLARHEAVAALSQAGPPLPMLELAFIGDATDVSLVQAAVEKAGGKYVAAK